MYKYVWLTPPGINPFLTNDFIYHKTFSLLLPAMSLGLRFCVSRNGETGGGGWVHPKGANGVAVSGLTCRKALVDTGRTISVLFGIN